MFSKHSEYEQPLGRRRHRRSDGRRRHGGVPHAAPDGHAPVAQTAQPRVSVPAGGGVKQSQKSGKSGFFHYFLQLKHPL